MGAKIIRTEKYEYYIIVAIFGFILFIPFFMISMKYLWILVLVILIEENEYYRATNDDQYEVAIRYTAIEKNIFCSIEKVDTDDGEDSEDDTKDDENSEDDTNENSNDE